MGATLLLIFIVNNETMSQQNSRESRIEYFFHDNARAHVAKSTREKLLKLEWITIPHPPYSPDLAPTEYHLYRSLSDYLREKQFDDENDLKLDLIKFFGQKSLDFYEGGIVSLAERCRQVVDCNGAYTVES